MSQFNETVRIVLGYAFAFFVVWVCINFMRDAFLDPSTAAIPEQQQGLIVGGLMAIISSAATFVFSQAVMNAASRSAATSTAAGVNAALTQPSQTVTVDAGPPATATVTPAGATATNESTANTTSFTGQG